MKALLFILSVLVALPAIGQEERGDSLTFQGQLSGWTTIDFTEDVDIIAGIRYIPQLNYQLRFEGGKMLDFEVSANVFGMATIQPVATSGQAKLYRSWVRYSTNHLELRLGLQKLNFGSASMLRPLMWFDRIDPRDPLQLTEGVWGLLGRYYFLNNANLWLWTLYGNDRPSIWESVPTREKTPEFGGRVQVPVPMGEAAITYNHRTISSYDGVDSKYGEDRFGLDAKFDMEVGLWLETSWSRKNAELGNLTNQHLLNLGVDYTFGVGNGLNVTVEQLTLAYSPEAFKINETFTFTGASLSYPLGMFDNLSAIFFYDWYNDAAYNYITWKKQFNKFYLYTMAYWNPAYESLPLGSDAQHLRGGKGIQLMIVFNH